MVAQSHTNAILFVDNVIIKKKVSYEHIFIVIVVKLLLKTPISYEFKLEMLMIYLPSIIILIFFR